MKRSLLGLAAFVALVGSALVVPGAASGAPGALMDDSNGSAWTQTKTLTRDWTDQDQIAQHDSRDVTVRADRTTDLQARERIHISWSGAHPSGARAANPLGENGMKQEYPVVVMQCRGIDDPSLPAAQQLSPNTCWTSTWGQRSILSSTYLAPWVHDAYATEAETAPVSGVDSLPAGCDVPSSGDALHLSPFVTAAGTSYAACSSTTMPPEAAVGSTDPPAELEGFSSLDGDGSADFEVRSKTENESLGCSHDVACSVVVIPIEGISCKDTDPACNRSGSFDPGSTNFAGDGVDLSASPALWWSASNWRNRFSIPISFGLPPSTCQLLGSGSPVAFYGSALLSQAALQWAPAYCLNTKRFNWQSNAMPDDAAFAQMTSGGAAAAEVTGNRETDSQTHVGYAPTAVSGYGIAFDIDQPNNNGPATSLNLNARLLAKLLTESYPGSSLGAGHPGLANNPKSINLDPEFQAMNPGLDDTHFSEAASTLLSLSTSSDVITSLTSYIKNDPDAAAFMKGQPDQWGMTINPSYKDLALPVSTWPLLDTWIPDTPDQECLKNNPAPYLPKVAAPVSTLQQIATAMLLNWPNVQTVCEKDLTTGVYKLGRIVPQGIGSRFMLGLVSLGDAARYGLPLASLQAAPGNFVAPDAAGLAGAVQLASQEPVSKKKKDQGSREKQKVDPYSAFELDQAKVRQSISAYPGMLIVHTAALTSGAPKDTAKYVSSFIDISSTEGQNPGRGNGQLPQGYLPITKKGVTGKLYDAARRVAKAVAEQKAPKQAGAGGGGSAAAPAVAPAAPVAAPAAPAATAPTTADTKLASAKTARTGAPIGGFLLPLLLFAGITAGVVASLSRLAAKAKAGGRA